MNLTKHCRSLSVGVLHGVGGQIVIFETYNKIIGDCISTVKTSIVSDFTFEISMRKLAKAKHLLVNLHNFLPRV